MAKKIDPSSIFIESIIVHNIPKHSKGDLSIEPEYSAHESSLPTGLRLFFKDKVVQALASDKSFKIVFDTDIISPFPKIAKDFLDSKGINLVADSIAIAKHLFEIQVGSNAAGILVVIKAKVNTFTTCIVLKLEIDEGAQLSLDPKTKSYNIQEVKDLMLTKKTKIFKVAMLIQRLDFESNWDGLIMDYQINVKAKREVITWFMERFLGCKAYEDPKITTQHFYYHTKDFIETIGDPIDKAKYIQDLNSYIQKNSTTLNPKEFADDYLTNTIDRDNYKTYLESQKFPFSAFPKDTTQIEKQISKIVILFENDICIIGNKGILNEKVKLERLPDGQTKAEIISKIKKIN